MNFIKKLFSKKQQSTSGLENKTDSEKEIEFKSELKDLYELKKSFLIQYSSTLESHTSIIKERLNKIKQHIINTPNFRDDLEENDLHGYLDFLVQPDEFELHADFLVTFPEFSDESEYEELCIFNEWEKISESIDKILEEIDENENSEEYQKYVDELIKIRYIWFTKIWHELEMPSLGFNAFITTNSVATIFDLNRVCEFESLPTEIQNSEEEHYTHEIKLKPNEIEQKIISWV